MLRQYLLGQKPETDLSQVEERLMTDAAAYEELLIVEDELIDQYVRGQLSDTDRTSFETYFMRSPERREKLRFAKALNKYVALAADEQQAPASESTAASHLAGPRRFSFWPFQSPVWNYALTAALVVLVVGISWLAVRSWRTPAPSLGTVYAVTLAPGGPSRSDGDIQTISIPADTDTVRLQLMLPADQSTAYSVRILAGDGQMVWQDESLKPAEASGKKVLEVNVPANLLKRDTYRIRLRAPSLEEIASYTFRIAK